MEFNFEEEMAKLKKLSESPALNLYSGRRMFVHGGQAEVGVRIISSYGSCLLGCWLLIFYYDLQLES